jgi:hypothetical protein
MKSPMPTAITAELPLRLVLDAERSVEIGCQLGYRADEPYTVRATFRTGLADIQWVIARDLLAEGLVRPAGDGDVLIWPEPGLDPLVVIILRSAGQEEAAMEGDWNTVAEFLDRTYKVVEFGSEGENLDLDAWIDHLLDRGHADR